jgi:hypothetical protein
MHKKRIASVFLLLPALMALQSCAMPGIPATANYNGGFPSSTTETHTRTTIVTPPSYATVNIPPPAITQAPPVVQQPMNYQYVPNQYQQPVQYQSNPCAPSQVGAYDPCAYQVSVPQQQPSKYTIAIPPAPAPQYTIALPQGNPPQYAVVQQQPPVQATVPVRVEAHSGVNTCD